MASVGHSARRAYLRLRRHAGTTLGDRTRNCDESMWLVGDGRSGTTWIAQLVSAVSPRRFVFEPCHPGHLAFFRDRPCPEYRRVEDEDPALLAMYRSLFCGHFQHPWTDKYYERWYSRGRLVKDIHAHLLMAWLHRRLPEVPKVLLLRHPYAIAASKMALSDWKWFASITHLLEQKHLVEDHLSGHTDFLQSLNRTFERYVALWCVLYRIPLAQFELGTIHVCFYEDFLVDPETSLRRLLQHVEPARSWDDTSTSLPSGFQSAVRTSSRVGRTTASGADPRQIATGWKSRIGSDEVSRGNEILERFGMHTLYDADGFPVPTQAQELLKGLR